jgi:hypothetical protein
VYDQIHAVYEAEHVAKWMYGCVGRKIGESYLNAPNIRKLMRKEYEGSRGILVAKQELTHAQRELLRFFDHHETHDGELKFKTPAVISWNLESRFVDTNEPGMQGDDAREASFSSL